MTKFQALFIKYLRVRCDNSWRAVHSEWQVRYVPKEKWWCNSAIDHELRSIIYALSECYEPYPDGNQIVGMELCNEAMNFLGETNKDGWN